MSFYSKSFFDLLIENQQFIKVKIFKRVYNENTHRWEEKGEPFWVYISLGTRLLTSNGKFYRYHVQIFKITNDFLQCLWSSGISFNDVDDLINEVCNAYSIRLYNESGFVRPFYQEFQIVPLNSIIGEQQ